MGRGDREGADRRRSRRSRSRSPVERERPERDRYEYDRHRERDGDRYERDRDRGDWRERDRDRTLRDRERERRPRSRSSSPSRRYRYRSPSPSTKPVDPKAMTGRTQDIPDDIDESEMTEEEKAMKEILGFCHFDTTQGKHIPGNDQGAVHVVYKRKYRQYMNRRGGFNRPLDYVA